MQYGRVRFGVLLVAPPSTLDAQQPQIPTLQVCNLTRAAGRGFVRIPRRSDTLHLGTFEVRVEVACDPRRGYPSGTAEFRIDMSDSLVQGVITATALEQVTSTGKHTPMAYISGRCRAEGATGCRFWLMMTDNKRTQETRAPDVVSFLMFNGLGQRLAYGSGPVVEGDIVIAVTSN